MLSSMENYKVLADFTEWNLLFCLHFNVYSDLLCHYKLHLQILEQIGKGVQFTLYKVESKIDGKIYVVKKVPACILHTPENLE